MWPIFSFCSEQHDRNVCFLEGDRGKQTAILESVRATSRPYFLFFQALYHYGREKKLIPKIPYGKVLLYSLSTSLVIGNIIIEPHAVRHGYYNFIAGLTQNKINWFNRQLLEPLRFNSNRMFSWQNAHITRKKLALVPTIIRVA